MRKSPMERVTDAPKRAKRPQIILAFRSIPAAETFEGLGIGEIVAPLLVLVLGSNSQVNSED
jgi:hypothetical protein